MLKKLMDLLFPKKQNPLTTLPPINQLRSYSAKQKLKNDLILKQHIDVDTDQEIRSAVSSILSAAELGKFEVTHRVSFAFANTEALLDYLVSRGLIVEEETSMSASSYRRFKISWWQ